MLNSLNTAVIYAVPKRRHMILFAIFRLKMPCRTQILLISTLLQACIDDNLDMVEFLVERGADVNRGDNEGWTPLHATASCGFLSIAK